MYQHYGIGVYVYICSVVQMHAYVTQVFVFNITVQVCVYIISTVNVFVCDNSSIAQVSVCISCRCLYTLYRQDCTSVCV